MDNADMMAYFRQMFDLIVWVMGVGFTAVGAVGGIKLWRDSNQETRMLEKLTTNMNENWGKILDNYIASQDRMVSDRLIQWGNTMTNVKEGLCKRMDENEKVLLSIAKSTAKNTDELNQVAEALARHLGQEVIV